jgi:hypothetical protein
MVFPLGSTNHADRAKPTSATPVHGVELGLVVLGNLDAAGAQLGDLRGDVDAPPAGLRRLLAARGCGIA